MGSIANDSTGMRIKNIVEVEKMRLVRRLADESVKLFGDLPSVSACGASEPFHGLVHAIRPGEVVNIGHRGGMDEREARGKNLHVPVLSQPSGLWVWVGYSHLDLEDNGGDAVTREPTVSSKEVHADRPSSGNVATTSLYPQTRINIRSTYGAINEENRTWMNGRNLGLMILKNGGECGNEGGNRISNTNELTFLCVKSFAMGNSLSNECTSTIHWYRLSSMNSGAMYHPSSLKLVARSCSLSIEFSSRWRAIVAMLVESMGAGIMWVIVSLTQSGSCFQSFAGRTTARTGSFISLAATPFIWEFVGAGSVKSEVSSSSGSSSMCSFSLSLRSFSSLYSGRGIEILFPPRVTRRKGSIGTIGIVSLEVAVVVVALLEAYTDEPLLLLTSRYRLPNM